MRMDGLKDHRRHHEGRRGGHRDGYQEAKASGAKTFRRGRAIAFLELLQTKRETLKKQLQTPELQSINSIIVGELKATEAVIDEFIRVFELQEAETEQNQSVNERKKDGVE